MTNLVPNLELFCIKFLISLLIFHVIFEFGDRNRCSGWPTHRREFVVDILSSLLSLISIRTVHVVISGCLLV